MINKPFFFSVIFLLTIGCNNEPKMETSFEWQDAEIANQVYEKTAMLIPVFIGEDKYYMQFDLATYESVLYIEEIPKKLQSIIRNQISKKEPINYWDRCTVSVPTHLGIHFKNGKIIKNNFNVINYQLDTALNNIKYSDKRTIIGTLGRDIITQACEIDYSNQYIVLDKKIKNDEEYLNNKTIDLRIYDDYEIYLPVKIKNKEYWALFDTGSSMFPLLVSEQASNALGFSTDGFKDSLIVSAWGEAIKLYYKNENLEFFLNRNKFNISILFLCKNDTIMNSFDFDKNKEIGIVGNSSFLHKKIIIDYQNKKMSIYTQTK